MKISILFFILTSLVFACSGDCTACHSNIVKKDGQMSKGHEKLTICKTCHTPKNLEKIDMGSEACGQDCWQCHSMKKVINSGIKPHEVLMTCDSCHTKLKSSSLNSLKTKPIDFGIFSKFK